VGQQTQRRRERAAARHDAKNCDTRGLIRAPLRIRSPSVTQANDVRTLKAAVDAALAAGKHAEAAQALEKLEKLEPSEPRWSQRLGDTYRRLNKTEQAVAAYGRAVDRLARGGFLARAIAMANTIASLDPETKGALARTSRTTFTDEGTGRSTLSGTRPDGERVSRTSVVHEPQPVSRSSVVHEPPRMARSSVVHEPPRVARSSVVHEPPRMARSSVVHEPPAPEQTGVRHVPRPAPVPQPKPAVAARPAVPQVPSLPPLELSLDDVSIEEDVMFVEDEPASALGPADRRRHASLLRGCQAFARVPGELLDALAAYTSLHDVAAGETVASAGSPADAVYLIVSGTVWAGAPGAADGTTMTRNELFAETCLLSKEPHACDFIATEELSVLRIDCRALQELGQRHEALRNTLVHIVGKRVITDLLKNSALFGRLHAATRKRVACAFEVKLLPANSVLFTAGEPGLGLYIPLTAKIAVTRDGSTRAAPAGIPIGQAALVSRGPVEFSARTLDEGVVLYLSADNFAKVRASAA
jgi:CRP-like cAMP-binding protein